MPDRASRCTITKAVHDEILRRVSALVEQGCRCESIGYTCQLHEAERETKDFLGSLLSEEEVVGYTEIDPATGKVTIHEFEDELDA